MIYVVRHGQTVWNAAGRFQGHLDSPLTRAGERQAADMGRALARLVDSRCEPLAAHVSPLGRARRTAALAAEHIPLDLIGEPRLAEVNMGAWDGLTLDEIDAEFPGALARTDRLGWFFCGPGGETFDALRARVSSWLGDLDDRPVAAFTHGVTSRVIRGVYLGLSRREMLAQATPQDGLYILSDGRAEFVDARSDDDVRIERQ